jgi:predicted metal-binding membrane protein
MALLFVASVMNFFWIAALAVSARAEKVLPTGRLVPRLAGLALIAGGAWLMTQSA